MSSFDAPNPPPGRGSVDCVELSAGSIPVMFRKNARARRYILYLKPGPVAVVTIPRSGTVKEAESFVLRRREWLDRAIRAQAGKAGGGPPPWTEGAEVLLRGNKVRIERAEDETGACVMLGAERIKVRGGGADFRADIQRHLWRLAAPELTQRAAELARLHKAPLRRVTVRNQRTRWGSCSRRGTVSLNWRLVQTPDFVRDYIILHELMHLREMNHSPRFWREVESVCPEFRAAERWLKENGRGLMN